MKKSKKIILTISAVTLTAGVLLTGIGYMKGGRFGFVFSDGKFISADSIEEEKQPFILEKKKLDSVKDIDINILSYATSGFCRLQTTPFTWSIICPVNTQSRLSPVQTQAHPDSGEPGAHCHHRIWFSRFPKLRTRSDTVRSLKSGIKQLQALQ